MASTSDLNNLKVLVCGGGNGAHTIAALAGSCEGVEVRWLSLFRDEAERIEKAMGSDPLQAEIAAREGQPQKILKSRPKVITNDPAKCVPGANLIIFSLPAFGHAEYFEKIAPLLEPNAVLAGMPGQFGFQFQAAKLLGEKGQTCTILCFETMPWACRIAEFGRRVEVLGVKDGISTSMNPMKRDPAAFDAIAAMQKLMGPLPVISVADNYLAVNLFTVVHPPIMYGQWKDWDGKPVGEKPLFYQGLTPFAAELLSKCSDELIETGKAIQKAAPQLDMSGVLHIFDWYKKAYPADIDDWSSLHAAMVCCKSYEGLTHPMKEVPGGLVPDFNYRYLSEDMPYAFCVARGIAELAGVKTPAIDETIMWCQKTMGKEYLVDGSMKGKDVPGTRAPQAYGYNSLQDIIALCGKAPVRQAPCGGCCPIA